MPQYRKQPIVVEAEQFFYDRPRLRGVYYPPLLDGTYVGDAFVITAHGQRVYLQNGDWVIAEADGEHYYPCKDEIFASTYEPADMPDALAAMTQRAEAAEAKLAAIPWLAIHRVHLAAQDMDQATFDHWITVADWTHNNMPQQEVQP